MLQLTGLALIANFVGLIVVALAVVGIRRARRQRAVALAMAFALAGIAVVIFGTTVVIACE
jgi:uncharacterized membrane protein